MFTECTFKNINRNTGLPSRPSMLSRWYGVHVQKWSYKKQNITKKNFHCSAPSIVWTRLLIRLCIATTLDHGRTQTTWNYLDSLIRKTRTSLQLYEHIQWKLQTASGRERERNTQTSSSLGQGPNEHFSLNQHRTSERMLRPLISLYCFAVSI